jgi:CDP-diacylglycerol---glycerol-3-phosphate 3-phosphatidyltransferase
MIRRMPSIYDLKPRFQALLRPIIARLAAWGWTPNFVTALALAFSVAVGAIIVLARQNLRILLLLPVWLFLRMALNAIDGMMARELNLKSTLGAVLNELGDVVSDLALYLPMAVVSPPSLWPVIGFALGAALTEFCGVLGQALGAGRRYEGPMGKSDRAFFVGALGLITGIAPQFIHYWPVLFGVAAALAALTCWNRLSRTLKDLRP